MIDSGIRLFSSESVTEGHPDKLCDYIADSILDSAISLDPMSRVACEVCAFTNTIIIFGEITSTAVIDAELVARNAIKEIGYSSEEMGINPNSCKVVVRIEKQSPDIAGGVNYSLEQRLGDAEIENSLGAGDQGMMFGYATNETTEYMPLPVVLAHALSKRLAFVRKEGIIPYLRPDGKAQVTIAYGKDGIPKYVDTVLVSTQHEDGIDQDKLRRDIINEVIKKSIDAKYINDKTKYLVNPSGRFVLGGPAGDSGLTGRKIIVDTYGGVVPHGGGAFSGKDPTKVDRSASYYARYVCKNMVAAGLADKLEVQVAYAIGRAKPVSLAVDSFGTGRVADDKILEIINKFFDFRPYSIIQQLNLRTPIYASTTNYGHFGKENLPWEKLDKVEKIKEYLLSK